jgi:hypothetical protein
MREVLTGRDPKTGAIDLAPKLAIETSEDRAG